jgi:hypothetical protein
MAIADCSTAEDNLSDNRLGYLYQIALLREEELVSPQKLAQKMGVRAIAQLVFRGFNLRF